MHALGERCAQDRNRGDTRSVARHDVHQARRIGPIARQPAIGAHDLAPTIEQLLATQLLLDGELQQPPVVHAGQVVITVLQDAPVESAGARHILERLGQEAVRIAPQGGAGRHQQIDDLIDWHREGRPRRLPRPGERVGFQPGRCKAGTPEAGERHLRAPHQLPFDEVWHGDLRCGRRWYALEIDGIHVFNTPCRDRSRRLRFASGL